MSDSATIESIRQKLQLADKGVHPKGHRQAAAREIFDFLKIHPHWAQGYYWLGLIYRKEVDYEQAENAFKQSLAIAPNDPEALDELAWILRKRMKLEEALAVSESALAINPNGASARANRAFALIQLGRWREGWRDYEARLQDHPDIVPTLPFPTWHGENLYGKSMLVLGEQGLGDQIQCARFLPVLSRLGAQVDVLVSEPLVRLIRTLEGVRMACSHLQGEVYYDYVVPMFSLPYRLNLTLQNCAMSSAPYFRADPQMVAHWRTQLIRFFGDSWGDSKPTIGLIWAGGHRPDDGEATALDQRRSMRLEHFLPLIEATDYRWLSLQTGVPAQAMSNLSGAMRAKIFHSEQGFTDFADSAGLMAHCTAIISVDTAGAHLAGALGRPLWILNRWDLCWRWLIDRADTPWYPSARLIRQPQAGDWQSVLLSLTHQLRGFLNH